MRLQDPFDLGAFDFLVCAIFYLLDSVKLAEHTEVPIGMNLFDLQDFIACNVVFIYLYLFMLLVSQRLVSGIAFTLICVIYAAVYQIQ